MFLWMRIPMMLVGLMAFDTKCTVMAFQPRPQRTTRMTTLRSQNSPDDLPVKVAVLENRMDWMMKTLERIESKIDTKIDELEKQIDRKIERMESLTKMDIETMESLTKMDIETMESLTKMDIDMKFDKLDTKIDVKFDKLNTKSDPLQLVNDWLLMLVLVVTTFYVAAYLALFVNLLFKEV
jgi:chaperonin cofactor prefoldin